MKRFIYSYWLTILLLSGLFLFSVTSVNAEGEKMSWDAIFEGVQMQQQAPIENVNFPGPYRPGERVKYVTGDPGLADLVDPGWKHVPKPPGDPDLGRLARPSPPPADTVIAPPTPGQRAPTQLQPGVAPAPSDTRIRQPSLEQLTPTRLQPGVTPTPSDTRIRTPSPEQLTPTRLQSGVTPVPSDTRIHPPTGAADGRGFPGPYQPGERVKYVTGDPGLADLADPGWKHVPKPPGDPDLGRLGQRTPPSTPQSTAPTKLDAGAPPRPVADGATTRMDSPGSTPTKVTDPSHVPALGDGTPTRIRDASVAGGRRPEPLTEGKSSFAPEKKPEPGMAEQVMSGVAVAGQIAEPATREMGDALRDNRSINAGQIAVEASGIATYDIGRRHAEEQLQRHHAGEQSKVEAVGRALAGTADEMVLQPIRGIVHQNLAEMESRAEAEGRRPTMAEGAEMYFGTMAEIAGAGFRPLLNAAYESQNYEAMGAAGGMQAEVEQFVDRNLTAGQRNIRQLQDQIEQVMHNGDPKDPATGAQLQQLLDQYDAEYDRMQRLEGMAERTLTHDPDRLGNVKNSVGHMTDSATMRDYAADIYEGRGGQLPAEGSAAAEVDKSRPAGSGLTPDHIEELVSRSGDKSLTQAERDQATHDLMNVLDVLRGGKKTQDEGKGGEGEGGGQETGGDVADDGKGPPSDGEQDDTFWQDLAADPDRLLVPTLFGPMVMSPEQLQDFLTEKLLAGEMTPEQAVQAIREVGDFNREFGEEITRAVERGDLLPSRPPPDVGSQQDDEFADYLGGLLQAGVPPTTPPDGYADASVAGNGLRDAEGEASDEIEYGDDGGRDESVLGGLIQGSDVNRDRVGEIQMIASVQDVRRATTSGDEQQEQAGHILNSSGSSAGEIVRQSTASTAAGDREHSWGNVLGDAVADGVKEGASQAATAFGQAAADRASGEIFSGGSSDSGGSSGSSSSGESPQQTASAGSGGGPYVNTYNPNMLGGGSSGGPVKHEQKPPKPPRVQAPPCPGCGNPMVFCADGQWHCRNSAYVRSNPGVVRKPPRKPPRTAPESKPPLTPVQLGPGGEANFASGQGFHNTVPVPSGPVQGVWVQDPRPSRSDGQVQPTGEYFIPTK